MADGSAELERQIARLHELAGLVDRAAPAIAVAVEREIASNIARGVGPDGTPWPPTKDGRQALANAARSLTVRAVGTTIVVTLSGIEVRHDLGAVRGGVRRQILPTGAIPDPITNAIRLVVEREFARTMGTV